MTTFGAGMGPQSALPSFGSYSGQPGQVEGVKFARRFAARLIDTVLHYFVSIMTGAIFGFLLAVISTNSGHHAPSLAQKMAALGLWRFVLPLIGYTGYMTICEGLHGSSFGKFVLGMAVITDDGRPCDMGAALKRSLAYFVDAFFFGVVGYLEMQKSPQQKRHGDNWAGTIVCMRANAPAGSLRSSGRFVGALILGMLFDAASGVAMFAAAMRT